MLRAYFTGPKFLFVIAFSLYCFAGTAVYAQQAIPGITVFIDEEVITLSQLLSRISEQTGLAFSYNPRKMNVQHVVSYRASGKMLAEVLRELSDRFAFSFEYVENQIVLKPDRSSPKSVVQTISGSIKDASTGEVLIGASVYISELETGAVTNSFGFYSVTVPPGSYHVTFSFIGYEAEARAIDISGPVREDITLKEVHALLETVEISNIPSVSNDIITSHNNVRPAAVEDRPEIFGEGDVVKSLESLPGVKFHSDGSTFYYVRGGHRDQNIVFIDDAPVYNPSHMLGIFSSIIPDAVNDITLYKGDMPASMGGRLSSVLDVRTKKGNDQHFSARGSVGLISTRLAVEGPFKKGASSYLLSGRFSSFRWLFKRAAENIRQFNFHDLTGKVNIRFNQNNRVFFSFYSGADNYFGGNNGIAWSNNAATLQWNHLFNDRLFLNTTIAGGGYDYFLHTDVANNIRWNAHISNFNIKTDFSYFIRPENELTFGAGLNGFAFNPGNLYVGRNASPLPVLSVRNALEFVLYGNHQVRVGGKFGINYGLRLSSWSNFGEAFEFRFDENGVPHDTLYFKAGQRYKQFINAEPRLTFSYFFNDNSSIKTSFSRNVQNIHLISNSISPFTSLDVWLPSSFNIKPQVARQLTLGYYYTHSLRAFSLSIEGFIKKMFNQIDYDEHAQVLLNPLLESELEFGTARAHGLELLLRRDEGRLRGWIGYTWSRTRQKFSGVNEGREYNAFYDRPHQVSITGSYDVGLRWQLGWNWNYSTGSSYSSPTSFYSYNGEEVPVYGQKNNARLPDYHRLDVSATYRLNRNPENRFEHTIGLSIFNFYARKNPLFINYNKIEADDGSFKIPANVNDVHRVPTQFYLFGFTPSISYNFKWL